MLLTTTYPALDLFWTLLEFAVLVLWIWLVLVVIGDVLRSADLSGWDKALWTLLVVVLPWLGVVIYLIARGGSMSQRRASRRNRPGPGAVYGPPTALSHEPLKPGSWSQPGSM